MRTLLARFRDFYGSRPLHLLTMLAGFAVVGYVLAVFKPVTLWNPQVWWQSIAVWFAAAIIAHDLVLFPVDCISHEAANAVKALCRQAGKRFIPLRSASVTALVAALQDWKVSSLAAAE